VTYRKRGFCSLLLKVFIHAQNDGSCGFDSDHTGSLQHSQTP